MMADNDITKKSTICWVDTMNFRSFLKVLLLNFRFNISEVRYLSASPSTMAIIEKLGGKTFKFLPIQMENKEVILDKELENLQDSTGKSLKAAIADRIAQYADLLPKDYDRNKLIFYFTQEMALGLRVPLTLLRGIPSKDSDNLRSIALIARTPWIKQLRASNAYKVAHIKTYFNAREFFEFFYHPIKVVIELIVNHLCSKMPRGTAMQDTEEPKIAVLHVHGADINNKCDYFWYPRSGIDPKNIIVYFKHHMRGPTHAALEHIEKNGLKWIDLRAWRFSVKPALPISFEINIFPSVKYRAALRTLLSLNLKFIKNFILERNRPFLWFWSKSIRFMDDVFLFESFFSTYNVKVHYACYEGGRHMSAANLALDRLGGIDLCHHWSNYDTSDLDVGKPHDVHFIWGPHYERIFDRRYYPVSQFISTGYSYDYLFEVHRSESLALRQRLEKKNVDFVISFFDQSISCYSSSWNEGQENLYSFLFQLVLNDPKVGLICKPKKVYGEDGLVKKFPGLNGLLSKVKATGRCIILDGSRLTCEASQHSDLAIGMGVSSTPSLEAALMGVPAITFNADGWQDHSMYDEGLHNIIFNDLDDLTSALLRFRKNRDKTDFGDYSFALDAIDSFRDGAANKRTGQYIKNVLGAFKDGKKKKEAMKSATQAYLRQYGQDKIVSRDLALAA